MVTDRAYDCHEIGILAIDLMAYLHVALSHSKGEKSRIFTIRLLKIVTTELHCISPFVSVYIALSCSKYLFYITGNRCHQDVLSI